MNTSRSCERFFKLLFRHLSEHVASNQTFSPFSIFSVLSLVSGGSQNTTYDEFRRVLSIDEGTHQEMKNFHTFFKGSKELSVAEGIFTQVELKDDFKKMAVQCYDAIVRKTKFPQPGETLVNEFVEKNTNGMIKKIVEDLSPATKMILVNAIYFKSSWDDKFEKRKTVNDFQFDCFGKPLKVSMMTKHSTEKMYGEHVMNSVSFKSCSLPYSGKNFSMIFLKPMRAGKDAMIRFLNNVVGYVSSISHLLPSSFIRKVMNEQRSVELEELKIPKFTMESHLKLSGTLQKMGIREAFERCNADFANLSHDKSLYISEVIHKCKIILDEEGTEAAAATAVVMNCLCIEEEPEKKKFVLDRPFVCFLVHNQTGIVLFCSTVVEPSSVPTNNDGGGGSQDEFKQNTYDHKEDGVVEHNISWDF